MDPNDLTNHADVDLIQRALTPDPTARFRLCQPCHARGICRMGLLSERLNHNGLVETDLICPTENQGGPGVATGGWTASVLNELVGHLPMLNSTLAVTGELTIRFLKPVPLDRPLRAITQLIKREGSRWFVASTIALSSTGAELARATATLVERDSQHYARHRDWLAHQEADRGAQSKLQDRNPTL